MFPADYYLHGMKQMVIRPIQPADNKAMASIIRNTLDEFGIGKRRHLSLAGTVRTRL
jgi:hypothetical protein